MESKLTISKLNNNNYFTWKFKMQMILTKEKVWKTIIESRPTQATELAAWNTSDETARALIVLAVEDNQLSLIMDKLTARGTWDALKEFHQKSTVVSKMTLMRNLFDLKMTDSTPIENHIEEVSNYLQKLNGLGVTAFNDESIKTALILSSLPDSYRTLVTSLEVREELTWPVVISKLLDEDKHRLKTSNQSEEKLLKAKADDRKKFCKYCKKTNHTIDECRTLKAKNANKNRDKNKLNSIDENSESDELLLAISNHSKKDKWTFDSGATSHFSNDKNLFTNLQSLNEQVTVANGDKTTIQGIGECKVDFINDSGEITHTRLTNVRYAPELHGNFISIKVLSLKGIKSVFRRQQMRNFHEGSTNRRRLLGE